MTVDIATNWPKDNRFALAWRSEIPGIIDGGLVFWWNHAR